MRQVTSRNKRQNHSDKALLKAVSIALDYLLSKKSVNQQAIERATGVDQTTISRAKNGKLKRLTKKISRLKIYIDTQNKRGELSVEVQQAARSFLACGGTEEELLGSIRYATSIILSHPDRFLKNP
jgi:predicted XRE-type DNA-binding protein